MLEENKALYCLRQLKKINSKNKNDDDAGFSIEGGTRRLIAAYFGIYSRLLCV